MGHQTPIADLEALRTIVRSMASLEPTRGVEIGSWAGLTAGVLAAGLDTLYCVDNWKGNHDNPEDDLGAIAKEIGPKAAFLTFCANLESVLYERVIPCVGLSSTYAKILPNDLDLVFIDADHRYEHVKNDITLWWPKVCTGGYLVLHDYNIFEGVSRAAEELLPRGKEAGATLWVTRKE